MPRIISPQTGQHQTVSDLEYTRLRQMMATERLDQLVTDVSEASETMRVFDVIDQEWTRLLPRSTVNLLTQEVTFKCSSCVFTSTHDGHVALHVGQVRKAGIAHGKAKVIDQILPDRVAQRCTGCDAIFSARKDQARHHLETVRSLAETHQGAVSEVVMHRFVRFQNQAAPLGERPVAEAVVKQVRSKRRATA